MVEQRYVQLQLARDTLVDPAKRFGYDRFGPDVTQWKHCTTIKDFVYTGMRGQISFYIASVLIMPIMAYMGFGDWGQYWRYLSIAALAAIELHTITRPTFTFITRIPPLPLYLLQLSSTTFPVPQLASLFNMLTGSSLANLVQRRPYLPFQALRVAHRATIAFFIALNRLGPVLSSSISSSFANDEVEGDTSDEALAKAFGFMERTVQISAAEAHRLLGLELVPFSEEAGSGRSGASGGHGDGKDVGTPYLREKLKEWFVTNTIRNDKEVEDAVERVIERRKGGSSTAADAGEAGFVDDGDAYDQE